eukprot:m.8707 g.8707  ORF g.8707 m.8707 type:complete len:189 (-) comp3945_c0_seq1:370-936(-)
MASLSYPASTKETLIVPVAPLGFTPLGKALSPTFVQQPSGDEPVSSLDFEIKPEEWSTLCDTLNQAFRSGQLSVVVGVLQWVPLVIVAGPLWINMRAEHKQRASIYLELARLQQSFMQPRNLHLQLHTHYVHRGRAGEQLTWLSISRNKGENQKQPVLVFTSNDPGKDQKHNKYCHSLYQKCEAKVTK